MGTGFGAHKGKNAGSSPGAGNALSTRGWGLPELAAAILFVGGSLKSLYLARGVSVSVVPLLGGASWGFHECAAQNSFAVWVFRQCPAPLPCKGALCLCPLVCLYFYPFIHPDLGLLAFLTEPSLPYRALQRLPLC